MTDTAVIEAPTTSTATESTTVPATTAQPSTVTTESAPTRPTSMRDALVKAEAATEPPAQPDGATTLPADATTSATKPEGPIPFTVHKTALDNARTKAVEEFKSSNPLASLPVETQRSFAQTAQRMTTDPVGFVKDYLAEVQAARPDLAAQLKGLFQPTAQQPDPMPEPDVQIVDAQGTVTGKTYSAERLAERDAWNRRQIMADVNKEVAPFRQEREQRLQTERQTAERQHVEKATDTIMGRIEKVLDGNKELFARVDELMAADPSLDALDAAFQIRDKHVLPSIAEKARLAAMESNKKKAAGNTASSSGTGTPPARPKNAKELANFMREHEARG